jgi:hypothetical protein
MAAVRDTFGYVGFLKSRPANLRTAATICSFRSDQWQFHYFRSYTVIKDSPNPPDPETEKLTGEGQRAFCEWPSSDQADRVIVIASELCSYTYLRPV